MTTQAMSLSLEQQNQQRQHQARDSGAAAQAPPSAITPKPKKHPPAPPKKPEHDLEPAGACLRVRNEGQVDTRPGVGTKDARLRHLGSKHEGLERGAEGNRE